MPTIHSLGQLKNAGGYDANTLSRGDWSWLPYTYKDPYGTSHQFWADCPGEFLVTQSNYNYRDVPAEIATAWSGNADKVGKNVLLTDTKPNTPTSPGAAPFKTQKTLGGRSLVADTFSQPNNCNNPSYCGWVVYPGMGQYAHRDGYNVLYGDWSARWYGDPQGRIMWWASVKVTPPIAIDGSSETYCRTSAVNGITRWTDGVWTDTSYGQTMAQLNLESNQGIWHILDNAVGIDSF
jgi:hypothetical protein